MILLLLVFLRFISISGEFNAHFAEFVEENYGKTFLDALQRTELGDNGSFGGKNSEDEEIVRDPVIFIHGVADVAGGKMHNLAAKFRKKGYTDAELYGTTYADGDKKNPLAWTEYSMRCEHVKQIRTLILAVRYYTLRDVDIIAYSLGVPIARKAILGGACVDTKEDLGSPLTNYIDTFVGVAGPNHGIALQIAGISIPGCVIGAIPILPICSRIIGLYSGLCPTESQFLTDINEIEHYEGRYVYSIYTKTDNWIGYDVCGQITARIPGEDSHKSFKTYNHDDILENTHEVQMRMIELHKVGDDVKKSNKTVQNRSKGRKAFRPSNISVTTSEEEDGYGRARKRNVEDYDYLSDRFNHPLLPHTDSSKKLSIAVARRGNLPEPKGREQKNSGKRKGQEIEDVYRGRPLRREPPTIAPETTFQTTSTTTTTTTTPAPTSTTTTTRRPTTTTTAVTTTYATPTHTTSSSIWTTTPSNQDHNDRFKNSVENLEKLTSKSSTYFPHPYESPDGNSADGYHTHVQINFDN